MDAYGAVVQRPDRHDFPGSIGQKGLISIPKIMACNKSLRAQQLAWNERASNLITMIGEREFYWEADNVFCNEACMHEGKFFLAFYTIRFYLHDML